MLNTTSTVYILCLKVFINVCSIIINNLILFQHPFTKFLHDNHNKLALKMKIYIIFLYDLILFFYFYRSKLNLLSNKQAIETLLGWFNIQHLYFMLFCDACYLILCYIRINLFIFLLFPVVRYVILLYDYKRTIFHFTNGLFTATSTSFVVSFVIDFPFGSWLFFIVCFCCPACWNNKVFSLYFPLCFFYFYFYFHFHITISMWATKWDHRDDE